MMLKQMVLLVESKLNWNWHGHLVDICAGECTQEFLQLATWNSCKNGCSRCTGCHH